jgi:hypothetical protein
MEPFSRAYYCLDEIWIQDRGSVKSIDGITAFAIFLLAVLSIGYQWYSRSNQTPTAQIDIAGTLPAPPRGPTRLIS